MVSQRQTPSESYLRTWDTDCSNVVTVPDPADERAHEQSSQEADSNARQTETHSKAERCAKALAALPVERLTTFSAGDPCAICQDFMSAGEEVRRLPCAHMFHAECIARWLHVKLTCPLDSLP